MSDIYLTTFVVGLLVGSIGGFAGVVIYYLKGE